MSFFHETEYHLGRGLMLLGHIFERCRICGGHVRSGAFGRNAETGGLMMAYPSRTCTCTTADRVRYRGNTPEGERLTPVHEAIEVSDGKMHQLLKAHQDKLDKVRP